MANQPEQTQYDSGVYQIEPTDPVDGGVGAVTNSPLLSLANRTNYLKKHIDDIESGALIPNGLAPLNSPALTGSPTSPTQAAGDTSTKIANSAFVQRASFGQAVVTFVAPDTSLVLTAAQYGCPIIFVNGTSAQTATLTFPDTPGKWTVRNNLSVPVILKTLSGVTSVTLTSSSSANIYNTGVGIDLQNTDFVSPSLTGTPTAVTPGQFLYTKQIVNLEALKARGVEYRIIDGANSSKVLTAGNVGGMVAVGGVGAANITLPAAGTVPNGGTITLSSTTSVNATNTILAQGSDTIRGLLNGSNMSASSFTMFFGDTVTLTSDGISSWFAASNSTANFIIQQFAKGQFFGTNGYQKIPGGLILQWGSSAITATSTSISFPVSFLSQVLWVGQQDSGGQPRLTVWSYTLNSLSAMTAYNIGSLLKGSSDVLESTNSGFAWFAIGR